MSILLKLGAPVRGFLEDVGDQAYLATRTLRYASGVRAGQLAVLRRQTGLQIQFTGLDSLLMVVGLGSLLGAVTVIQAFGQLSGLGAENYIGVIMVLIVLRELGPLLTAVVIVGRSSTAIAAELAAMQLNGEVDALVVHGVNPYQYLLLPRWIGVFVSFFALVIFFDAAALAGGFLVSNLKHDVTFGFFMNSVKLALSNRDFAATVFKALVFPAAITLPAFQYGLRVRHSQTESPQAVTKTVVFALLAVFVLDGVAATVFYSGAAQR